MNFIFCLLHRPRHCESYKTERGFKSARRKGLRLRWQFEIKCPHSQELDETLRATKAYANQDDIMRRWTSTNRTIHVWLQSLEMSPAGQLCLARSRIICNASIIALTMTTVIFSSTVDFNHKN